MNDLMKILTVFTRRIGLLFFFFFGIEMTIAVFLALINRLKFNHVCVSSRI